jgi:hypothetical protein
MNIFGQIIGVKKVENRNGKHLQEYYETKLWLKVLIFLFQALLLKIKLNSKKY